MSASISCLFTLGSKGYFFLIDPTYGSRRARVNKARALSNREHGSFNLRYFKNGPLDPGYCLLGSHPEWKPGVVWQQWTAAGFNTYLQTLIVGVRIFVDSLTFPCHWKWTHLLSPQLPNFIYCHWSQSTWTSICNDIEYQKWEKKLHYLCFILNGRVS